MKSIAIGLTLFAALPSASADWKYIDGTSKLTGEATKTAEIISTNSMDLKFPYQGRNTGRLSVIKAGKGPASAIFDFDKGQTMCSNPASCLLMIRFDDAKPVTFEGSRSADHATNVVFLNNSGKFISLATKAKRIYVGLNLYQNGTQLLEFNSVKPLEWAAKK